MLSSLTRSTSNLLPIAFAAAAALLAILFPHWALAVAAQTKYDMLTASNVLSAVSSMSQLASGYVSGQAAIALGGNAVNELAKVFGFGLAAAPQAFLTGTVGAFVGFMLTASGFAVAAIAVTATGVAMPPLALALGVTAVVTAGLNIGAAYLANDPPDPDYETVLQPSRPDISFDGATNDESLNTMLSNFATNGLRATESIFLFTSTLEKLQGAELAADAGTDTSTIQKIQEENLALLAKLWNEDLATAKEAYIALNEYIQLNHLNINLGHSPEEIADSVRLLTASPEFCSSIQDAGQDCEAILQSFNDTALDPLLSGALVPPNTAFDTLDDVQTALGALPELPATASVDEPPMLLLSVGGFILLQVFRYFASGRAVIIAGRRHLKPKDTLIYSPARVLR